MVVAVRTRTFVVTLTLVLGIGVALVSTAVHAHGAQGGSSTGEEVATSLVGTWIGPKSGAEGGKFETREWRVVFRESQANAAIGTKQYRQPNGRWSKREVVNAVVDSTGEIWAADTDGILHGSLLDDGTLELIYQEAGTTDGAAVIALLQRQS
jgi:hypothetical protein